MSWEEVFLGSNWSGVEGLFPQTWSDDTTNAFVLTMQQSLRSSLYDLNTQSIQPEATSKIENNS